MHINVEQMITRVIATAFEIQPLIHSSKIIITHWIIIDDENCCKSSTNKSAGIFPSCLGKFRFVLADFKIHEKIRSSPIII